MQTGETKDQQVVLPILGMTYATCSAAMERSLRNEEGFMVATRKIIFVTRSDATKAKGLKSKQEVLFLSDQGGLTLEESNIVFHIPFTTWKDSQR